MHFVVQCGTLDSKPGYTIGMDSQRCANEISSFSLFQPCGPQRAPPRGWPRVGDVTPPGSSFALAPSVGSGPQRKRESLFRSYPVKIVYFAAAAAAAAADEEEKSKSAPAENLVCANARRCTLMYMTSSWSRERKAKSPPGVLVDDARGCV
jgi:hypothetical protein